MGSGRIGGERAAAISSTFATAKLNDVGTEAYPRDILAPIADRKIDRVEELLPWAM